MVNVSGKVYRLEEIRKHNVRDDLWIIVDKKVYDLSDFVDRHPGGDVILLQNGGTDASNNFKGIGHSDSAKEMLYGRCIGEVDPDDAALLKEPIQATRSPAVGIVLVFILLGVTFYTILHSIFSSK